MNILYDDGLKVNFESPDFQALHSLMMIISTLIYDPVMADKILNLFSYEEVMNAKRLAVEFIDKLQQRESISLF